MKFKKDEALAEAGAYEELELFNKYNNKWIFIAILVGIFTVITAFPVYYLTALWNVPILDRLSFAGSFYADFFNMLIFANPSGRDFFESYISYWLVGMPSRSIPAPSVLYPIYAVLAYAFAFPIILGLAGRKMNPYRSTPNIYGDARWATVDDVMKMGARSLVGFNKRLFLIGRLIDKKDKKNKNGRLIQMDETLSILLLAPPGTGKSIGFIVPSTVVMDDCCLFIHDQKPELFDMTSGHRNGLGPVFQIKWSAQDAPNGELLNEEQVKRTSPDLLLRDEDGNLVKDEDGNYRTKPTFYPSWNPLSPKSMPGPGDKRDLYIDRLVNVLCPDAKSGDKFWTEKGRVGLLGMIQYLVAKVDYATHPLIKGGWKGIPEQWHNREASFPMLIDWLNWAQLEYNDDSDDPMKQMFKVCIEDAKKMDIEFKKVLGQSVLNRASNELVSLMNAADKTRSSILQTIDAALNPFKNAAVRQRTSTSDFAFYELRGMPTDEAKKRELARMDLELQKGKIYKPRYKKEEFRPVTIFISIPAEDAKTFSSLTGIFVDAANAYLVANGPNAVDDQGNQNGPHDFGFLLDEAPQLPKLDTIMNGPAVGRSKRVFYVIVGQDFGQFMEKYSKEEVETLKSTTAIKIILAQNNDTSAKQISQMVGKMTVKKNSLSEKSGGGNGKGLGGAVEEMMQGIGGTKMSSSYSLEGVDFIKPEFVMSMPEGMHLAIVQNYANRPLYLKTPKFFIEPEIKNKVYNLRDYSGPPPCLPMPQERMNEASIRWHEGQSRENESQELREKLEDPRVVICISPADIASIKQGESGTWQEDSYWAFTTIELSPDAAFMEDISKNDVKIIEDPEEAALIIADGKVMVFDEDTFERLNAWLPAEAQANEKLAIFVAKRAEDIGEDPGIGQDRSLFNLGYKGSASLDAPVDPSQVDGYTTTIWLVDCMTFILSIEEQRKLFDLN